MKSMLASVVVVTCIVAVASVAAQSKPSFAGKWTLVPDPNVAGGGGGAGRTLGAAFSATQDEKSLTVATTDPQVGEIKSVYNLDGSESKNPLSFGGQTIDRVSKAKWDGAKLVITNTLNVNGTSIESTQTWSFDTSGNLTVEEASTFRGKPTTSKSTYKK